MADSAANTDEIHLPVDATDQKLAVDELKEAEERIEQERLLHKQRAEKFGIAFVEPKKVCAL